MPNLHFTHSVLATGVKCFHVVPSRSQEELKKSAFVPTLIRILKQAGKQMQVWRSGGKLLPTLVPHLGPHPAVWSDGMLGGSSGKTGMKKRKTCRAYVLLRMGKNINSWQPLPSPKPALERVQTGIHAPPSPPAPQPSHQ